VTTAAKGIHSAVFNRIMLRPGGLYRRIGQTKGYSVLFYSDATLKAARDLVAGLDDNPTKTTDRPIRLLKRAFDICGVPRERFVKLGFPKGVYVAFTGTNSLAMLRTPDGKPKGTIPVSTVTSYWKSRDLSKVSQRKDLLDKVRGFNGTRRAVMKFLR
jgi:hypothetical protein